MSMYNEITLLCSDLKKLKEAAAPDPVPTPLFVATMVIRALTDHMQWDPNNWNIVENNGRLYTQSGDTVTCAAELRVPLTDIRIRAIVHVKERATPGVYYVECLSATAEFGLYDDSALAAFVAEAAGKVRKSFLESAF